MGVFEVSGDFLGVLISGESYYLGVYAEWGSPIFVNHPLKKNPTRNSNPPARSPEP